MADIGGVLNKRKGGARGRFTGICVFAGAFAVSTAMAQTQSAAPARLDIFEFAVDGNTVLSETTIVETLEPYVGPDRSTSDIDAARSALETAYRQRGYKTVSVGIPRQTVTEGTVVLQVTEGRVRHLNVVGSRYHSLDAIKADAPSLAEGRVPDFDEVKEDLVALNQQADRRVTPALKAGSRPGTVDVDLAVTDSLPLHGSLELNNRRSQDTTALRAVASLSYDNLWQRGHSLSVSYQTAPKRSSDAKVWFGSYLARFGRSPFSLLLNALHSDSDVASVGGVEVLGNGDTFGVRGVWSLPGSDHFYQSLSAGIDYKNFDNTVGLGDDSFSTPLEYYPVTLSYTAIRNSEGSSLQGDAGLTFSLPEAGSDTYELDLNRYQARSQQFHLNAGLGYTRVLWRGFEGHWRFAGQWTDEPLVTNEQLSAGGADTTRGYLEAESLGDYGFTQTAEFRSPGLQGLFEPLGMASWFENLQAFSFLDGALLRLHEPLPGTAAHQGLLSAGLGLNLQLLSHFDGSLDWAMPLDDGPTTSAGDSRWLFRVRGSF